VDGSRPPAARRRWLPSARLPAGPPDAACLRVPGPWRARSRSRAPARCPASRGGAAPSGLRRERRLALLVAVRVLAKEVRDQGEQVLGTLAQRRDRTATRSGGSTDRPGTHPRGRGARDRVRRRDDPRVDGHGAGAPTG
jgi:hypothetical protein